MAVRGTFRWALCLVMLVGMPAVWATSVSAQDEEPRIMVHYMPWYQARPFSGSWGWHWTMDHFDPEALDATGQRQIASHYYPLIGPYDSRDPAVLEYHALTMKVAGIDGVIVDWYGTAALFDYPMLHEATQLTFEAMKEAGLSFAICYEDQTIPRLIENGRISAGEAISHAQAQMLYVEEHWMHDPAYLRLDGAPVLLNFGPQYFESATEWAQVFQPMEMAPSFFTLDSRLEPVAPGAFAWPPMHLSSNGTLTRGTLDRYLNLFYAYGTTEWPSFIGGAFPGFHDIYEEAGVGTSYGFLDAQGGGTFERTLDRAFDAGAPIIQIVTWNDFGEGTNVEPAKEYGYQYLAMIQERVREHRALPYSSADLALPLEIYGLRKHYGGGTAADAELDRASDYLLAGDADAARAIVTTLTGTEQGDARPVDEAIRLSVFPNPVERHGTISIGLSQAKVLEVALFDVTGKEVMRLTDKLQPAGRSTIELDTGGLAGGVYFVRARTAEGVITRPVVVRP